MDMREIMLASPVTPALISEDQSYGRLLSWNTQFQAPDIALSHAQKQCSMGAKNCLPSNTVAWGTPG